MKRLFLLSLSVCCLLTCNQEDITPLSTCVDGTNYVLDYQPEDFWLAQLWLTESDGDLAFVERNDPATVANQFYSFEDACEDVFTVSYAWYPNIDPDESAVGATWIEVEEYGDVPSGTSLDRRNPTSLRNPGSVGSQPESRIEIRNCPPVDSVRLWESFLSFESEFRQFYTYEYLPDDSILIVNTLSSGLPVLDGLLAIRTTADQSWHGQIVDLQAPPADLEYGAFSALSLRSVRTTWPSPLPASLEIQMVTSIEAQRTLILAQAFGTDDLVFPVLDDNNGPFIVKAEWVANAFFEASYVYEELPEELVFGNPLTVDNIAYAYPNLELEAGGANIINMYGSSVNGDELCIRRYFGPLREGFQTIRLAPLPPALDQDPIKRLYEAAFGDNNEVQIINYPAMEGSYSWYLRNVLSPPATGALWLESLEYELIELEF